MSDKLAEPACAMCATCKHVATLLDDKLLYCSIAPESDDMLIDYLADCIDAYTCVAQLNENAVHAFVVEGRCAAFISGEV